MSISEAWKRRINSLVAGLFHRICWVCYKTWLTYAFKDYDKMAKWGKAVIFIGLRSQFIHKGVTELEQLFLK